MSTKEPAPLPRKLVELIDELDQEIRSLPAARAIAQRQVRPELAAMVILGLRHLLDGEGEQAAQLFEAMVEEIQDRTVSLDG